MIKLSSKLRNLLAPKVMNANRIWPHRTHITSVSDHNKGISLLLISFEWFICVKWTNNELIRPAYPLCGKFLVSV